MSFSSLLRSDLKEAVRSGDSLRVSVVRMALAALHNREIGKRGDLTEDEELEVLAKEAKKRRESVQAYRAGGRESLAKQEEQELRIIEKYLPERLSGEELEELVRVVAAEIGVVGPADLGRLMGAVMAKVKGRAEGTDVRRVAEGILGGEMKYQ